MTDILNVERKTAAIQGAKHSPELQSARGLAALVVILHHSSFYLSYNDTLRSAAEIFFQGHAAVVFFFVLSGFVLTLSLKYAKFTITTIFRFYIKRVFRIYPALWVGVGLAASYAYWFRNQPMPAGVSSWSGEIFATPELSPLRLLAGAAGVGWPGPIPMWSLTIEIAASIAMPFIAFALFRSKPLFALMFVFLLAVSMGDFEGDRRVSRYMIDFAIGAAIVPVCRLIVPYVAQNVHARLIAVLALLVMVLARQLGPWGFEIDYDAWIPALVEALAAAVLIGVIHSNTAAFAVLRRKSLVWLGDISYSVYLLHLPILGLWGMFLGNVGDRSFFVTSPIIATATLAILTFVTVAFISALTYAYVEIPGIALGKRFLRMVPPFRSTNNTVILAD